MALRHLSRLVVLALLCAYSAFGAGTIGYGSRIGMNVTIKSMTGLDTSHAVIHTAHTRDNAIEFCREYELEDPVTDKCINQELSVRLNDAIYADCPRGLFTDFGGDKFQFRGKNRTAGQFGPKYILMNLRTREIADGSSASGYDVNMEIFRALCPRTAPPPDADVR
jgi:hypothetical protein